MKIIDFLSAVPAAEARFMPDSTLLLPGRPMFFPEEGEGWLLVPRVAVHLNRLGKGVSPKFAPRYYDAVSAALQLTLPGHPAPGLLSGMDSTVACGLWQTPAEGEKKILINGREETLRVSLTEINAAIAALSRLTTVKMGDIVLMPAEAEGFAARPHTRVEITDSEGDELLNLKIV